MKKEIEALREVVEKLKNLIKFFKCLPFDRDAFVLSSTPRSGTHWFRHIFVNYLFMYYEGIEELVTFRQIVDYFPNSRENIIKGIKPLMKPHPIITKAGYRNFLYGHGYHWFFPTSAKRVLFLYRNPLDFLVSWYYYRYKNDINHVCPYDHPREVIDSGLAYYMGIYGTMRRGFPKITYEDLVCHTHATFTFVLSILNIPVNHRMVDKAISFSTLEQSRKETTKQNFPWDGGHKNRYRSGKIGEWQEYFNKKDIEYVEFVLAKKDIHLNEFQTT